MAGPNGDKTVSALTEGDRYVESSSDEMFSLQESNSLLQRECQAAKHLYSANLVECARLRDQVSRLFQENCSLKEHSAKLAIESKDLKKQMASVKADNVKLREKLQQFSQQLKSFIPNDEFNCHSQQQVEQVKTMLSMVNSLTKSSRTEVEIETQCDPMSTQDTFPFEMDHCSLEQISNRLLEHLKQEKRELEQQYTQMVEIQKSSLCLSGNASSFSKGTALNFLDLCRNSSKLLKQEAHLQNNLLATLVKQMSISTALENVPRDFPCAPSETTATGKHLVESEVCIGETLSGKPETRSSLEALLDVYGNHLPGWEGGDECECTNDEDRICPMCQAVFPKAVPLTDFELHVMEHFRSEDFEIVSHEPDYN